MRKVLFFYDVPDELITLLNAIDFKGAGQARITSDLAKLRDLADKHIPIRQKQTASKEREIAEDVPVEAINIINRYEYEKLSKFQLTIAKPVIITWAKRNIPMK